MKYTIRRAKQEDLSAIAALHAREGWHFATVQELQHFLQQGHTILVAETDGTIVGKIDLIEKIQNREKILSIQRLIVHPEYREKGIATALLAAAEEECKQRNICYLVVAVREKNDLVKLLYEKNGFKEIEKRIYLQKEVKK